jgi:predicted N-acetyltransferase YhbS
MAAAAEATGKPVIGAEGADQDAAIELVLDRAFGPGRFAKTSERVREHAAALDRSVSRVAMVGDALIGCCRMSRLNLDAAPIYFLGPLAIDPDWQGHRLARPLIAAALASARATDAIGVLVIGRPALFAAYGFAPIKPGTIAMPGPIPWERLQGLHFAGAALAGTLRATPRKPSTVAPG